MMVEMIEEMSDTIRHCEREYRLYQGEEIQDLMTKLYIELFSFLEQSIQLMTAPTSKHAVLLQISSGSQGRFPIVWPDSARYRPQ